MLIQKESFDKIGSHSHFMHQKIIRDSDFNT